MYFGIDGTFVNEKEAKAFLEAKAAIVFTNDYAVVGRKRRVLLNKQYTGTFFSVEAFSEIVDYHTFKRNGFYISSVVAEKTID